MINLPNILLWVISIANGALAFLVVSKDRKNIINRSFGIFAFGMGLWSLAILLFRSAQSVSVALFMMKAAYVAALLIAIEFWHFSIAFPDGKRMRWTTGMILWTTGLGLSMGIIFSPLLVRSVAISSSVRFAFLDTNGYILFAIFFSAFFFGALGILRKQLRQNPGPVERLQLAFIFWSVLIAGSGGAFFNLVLPSPFFNEWRFIWIGPICTFLIVLMTTYAIIRHRLLNIRAIAAELLTIGLVVGLAIEMILSLNWFAAISRGIVLLVVASFGFFLVRNIEQEIKRREEMERLSEELEIAYNKLKEVDQAKTDFLSLASHQLRSPLTVIKVGLGALLDGVFGPVRAAKQRDAMKTIVESADRLIHLIGEYLDISRIELGKMEYHFASGDLGALVATLVGEYTQRAESKGLKLAYKPSSKLPHVPFDNDKMRQVITNLLDNAIKYTPSGSVSVHCSETTLDGAPAFEVAVADSGRGLSKEDMGLIFQKFKRASGKSMRMRDGEPVEGSGLGLHVAKMFVEAHKGKIWAESKGLGKGSIFKFAIPIVK